MAVRFRKLADKSSGERIVKFDPNTGERKLVNPATPGDAHEPWPLAGVEFVDGIPNEMVLPTKYVDQAVSEGWMSRVGERPVVRPAGPRQDVYNSSYSSTPHLFMQCDKVIVHTTTGDVVYKVSHQPDKYVDSDNPEEPVTPELYSQGKTRVDYFYGLKLDETHNKMAGSRG